MQTSTHWPNRYYLRAVLVLVASIAVAEEGQDVGPAAPTSGIRVVNLFLEDGGALYWGTNTVTLGQISNRLMSSTGRVDAIALHTKTSAANLNTPPPALLPILVRKAAPVLLVEEGEAARPAVDARPSLRKISIGLDPEKLQAIAGLHNKMTRGNLSVSSLPSVKTSFELSDQDETYHFQKIELGLRGRRTWLMHERINDEESTTGIQLKKTW